MTTRSALAKLARRSRRDRGRSGLRGRARLRAPRERRRGHRRRLPRAWSQRARARPSRRGGARASATPSARGALLRPEQPCGVRERRPHVVEDRRRHGQLAEHLAHPGSAVDRRAAAEPDEELPRARPGAPRERARRGLGSKLRADHARASRAEAARSPPLPRRRPDHPEGGAIAPGPAVRAGRRRPPPATRRRARGEARRPSLLRRRRRAARRPHPRRREHLAPALPPRPAQ